MPSDLEFLFRFLILIFVEYLASLEPVLCLVPSISDKGLPGSVSFAFLVCLSMLRNRSQTSHFFSSGGYENFVSKF